MLHDVERRAVADVSLAGRQLQGYAVVFNTLSADLGGFREVIMPEAVDRTLREGLDVRALVDHDTAKVLGRTAAGTLRLAKDDHGLRAEIDPPDTTAGRDVVALVQRGDVTGMSFAFQVIRPGGERFERRDGQPVRIISDMAIQEVSIVTFPAYVATDAQVAQRALQAFERQRNGRSIAWLRKWHTASRGVN
jgi:HK97 family phage prohead protease